MLFQNLKEMHGLRIMTYPSMYVALWEGFEPEWVYKVKTDPSKSTVGLPEESLLSRHNIIPGSLVAIVGPVGSGKSSLLSSILGELQKIGGTITLSGSVAFSAQQVKLKQHTKF